MPYSSAQYDLLQLCRSCTQSNDYIVETRWTVHAAFGGSADSHVAHAGGAAT